MMILNGMEKNNHSLNKIFSALIPANLSELNKQMEADGNLRKLLTTPGKDLPSAYKFLMSEELSEWQDKTLYDLISGSLNFLSKDEYCVSEFSKAGDKIIGWCCYKVDTSRENRPYEFVSNIKMFSFDINRPNPVLLRDLKDLIYDLMDEYQEVSWVAVKENPANRIYQRLVDDIGGRVTPYENKLIYQI